MKKTVTTLLVVATVFLCSFNVFATSSTGRSITSSSYSWNNGDVSSYVRVNGKYSYNEPGNNAYGVYYYEHNFTVTLANNTNEFQVADTNTFSIDLYTGYTDTFSTSGTRPAWGNYVTSYSDNMSIPRVIQHNSGDLSGHVIITFQDSDLLVLNPNETREYNFSIMFTQDYDSVQQSVINGDVIVSYFTYTGNVSMYSKPSSFTENTILDFINNDSFPNSVVAYLLANYEANQEIIDYISNTYPSSVFVNALTSTGLFWRASTNVALLNTPYVGSFTAVSQPRLIDAEFVPNDISQLVASDQFYAIDYYAAISLRNESSKTYELSSLYITYDFVNNVTSNADFVGTAIDYVILDGLVPYSTTTHSFNLRFAEKIGSHTVFPSGYTATSVIKITYYYSADVYDTTAPNVTFSYNAPTITMGPNSLSASEYSQSLFSSIAKNFADIRDLLIGNKTNNDAISDQVNDNQSQEDIIHAQEEQWYQDNETAITAVGLSNYQFSGDQTSGLSGVTSQFTSVWNSLDGWTNVYIFVLTLSLATFILRHKAETKAAQKSLDEYRPYSVAHLVRRRRSYH